MLMAMILFVAGASSADEAWWQFRGPTGEGHACAKHLPLTWSETQNVAWKTAIHDRGWSSPVILGNQIWMTTATEDGRKLFAVCVDRDTGQIVHDRHVFDVEDPQPIAVDNTYATPTPVIESGRIYVHFLNENAVCTVVKPARNFEVLAVNQLKEEPLMASPAVVGNALFIRTERHLYRIEATSQQVESRGR